MNVELIFENIVVLIIPAFFATVRILLGTTFFSILFGFPLAIILYLTNPHGLKPNKRLYSILSFILNSVRSFPGIVLIVALAPITRLVVGTMIGEKAAIVPLTIGSIPFIANTIENALYAVDPQLILAAKSFGATDLQIVFRVVIVSAKPNLVRGLTLCIINFLKNTVLAGAVGAGGLGSVALNYGFYSFNDAVLYSSVFILFLFVHFIQFVGEVIYRLVVK